VAGRRASSARPRAHSQHFLRSPALAADLVRAAGVGPGDLVVDIGAGTGRITAELARSASRVIAIELDRALAARLAGRWPNVEVVNDDVRRVTLPDEPFAVVANLPFGITTDVLHHLLDDPTVPLRRADLVVQWPVAVKFGLPWPSSVNGVVWSAYYEPRVDRRLPAESFVPRPEADAGVIVFSRRAAALVPPGASRAFRAFVATGFRRGLRGERRFARDLDAHEWAARFTASTATSSSGRRRAARRS